MSDSGRSQSFRHLMVLRITHDIWWTKRFPVPKHSFVFCKLTGFYYSI